MNVENGWISPYMVRDRERMETVLEDPYILMTDEADHAPAGPPAGARRGHEVAAAARHPGREGRRRGARDARARTTSTARSRRSRSARPASATGASTTSATSRPSPAAR